MPFWRSINDSITRRQLDSVSSCGMGNPIHECWRCDPNWKSNQKRLADCGIGFGRNALGGVDGDYYVVTDSSDDDPVSSKPDKALWITFDRDMVITLKQELIMNSFKTLDGRGANLHIAKEACITVHYVTKIIIHGILSNTACQLERHGAQFTIPLRVRELREGRRVAFWARWADQKSVIIQ